MTAITDAIKTVGVGKRGSRSLSADQVQAVLADMQAGRPAPEQIGALFGALIIKGVTDEEKPLLRAVLPAETMDPWPDLLNRICSDAPEHIRWIARHLLEGHTLDEATARDAGTFLFSDQPGHSARGLIAAILRVRYETQDEYAGILTAMQATVTDRFRKDQTEEAPVVIQMAEPFDGVDHSHMITPLLAAELQKTGARVISLCGRHPGPKQGINLQDVAESLDATYLTNADNLNAPAPDCGWFVRQQEMSPALDAWVEIRRNIVKRPFVSTLERFLRPCGAGIAVASAFHPPYGEKMLGIAERAGFRGAVIVRNGIEGTLAFALKRAARVMCTARQVNGEYKRQEFIFNPADLLGQEPATDDRVEPVDARTNAALIQEYARNGTSGHNQFDARVRLTAHGLTRALAWVRANAADPA